MDLKGKRAFCYFRVSSDDQVKGNSLTDQQERLKDFCHRNEMVITGIFSEDCSAKSFNRPQWNRMLDSLKKTDYILFTNWSRFSRAENMGESFMMIDRLLKANVQPQSIENFIDFSIPESKYIIAFYIASPAVENLRRASNVRYGQRRSSKMGRWCWTAPFGYINSRDESNKPQLKINPARAQIIKDIFQQYLDGRDPKLILREAVKKGFTIRSHSAFPRVITNPIYAGMIRVFALNSEPEEIVKGLHEPIISEDIFYAVQNKWNGNNRSKSRIYDESLPLRGIVRCNNCGHTLTGGRSRGKTGHYWLYYRCLRCRGENYSVAKGHEELEKILEAISLKPEHITDLIANVDKSMKEIIKRNNHEAETLSKEIKGIEEKLSSLEEKYIGNKLDFETYQLYYPIYRRRISEYRLRQAQISGDQSNLIELYKQALPRMTNLAFLYEKCSLENKQQLLRLIFPGNLYKLKEGGTFRTIELNPLFTQPLQDVGLIVGDKVHNTRFVSEVQRTGSQSNPVEALLTFVLKIAA